MHQQLHPAVTPADVLLMTPHERAYFTDEPVAHRVAQLDFERDLMIERRNREIERSMRRRPVVMDPNAARVFA